MKILIAPLDWGLGHATRCIPLIRSALEQGHDISIACEPKPRQLLQNEFPELNYYSLEGIQVTYPKGIPMLVGMILQSFSILRALLRESRQMKQLQNQFQFDVILSDNRFGVRSSQAYSIYMTHQITIAAPSILQRFEPLGKWLHSLAYSKADQLWIPDFPSDNPFHLAGRLSQSSHPKAKYLGILSRFTRSGSIEKSYDICICLSGPEPLRTSLEEHLCIILANLNLKVVLVRGKPADQLNSVSIPGVELQVYNHLGSKQLSELLQQSRLVISRSGYSSLMDYKALGIPALIVPTPGQTEQELLGKYLSQSDQFISCNQSELTEQIILDGLKYFESVTPTPQPTDVNLLKSLWNDVEKQIG